MAIYDQDLEYRKLNATKNAEILGALQAFGNFINQRKELEQNAPYKDAMVQQAIAEAGMKQAQMQAYMNPQVSPAGGIQKTKKDILGNEYMTQEYMDYLNKYNKQKQDAQFQRQKELADYRQKLKGSDPLTSDAAGRYSFAREVARNTPKIMETLFPDGTPNSFDRNLATKIMAGRFPNDTKAQDLKRWLLNSAVSRGLIQSGTVVKDNEWGRIMQAMGIDILSSPQAAYNSIVENDQFHKDFMNLVRPGFNDGESSSSAGTKQSSYSSLWS